ncbi:hypothetical protein BU17DRAFT_65343 [Hysterangium stoloniferum]|nr:hypothetical protein BU17DRAFT_65343 [Hysterangium stoloniferum]
MSTKEKNKEEESGSIVKLEEMMKQSQGNPYQSNTDIQLLFWVLFSEQETREREWRYQRGRGCAVQWERLWWPGPSKGVKIRKSQAPDGIDIRKELFFYCRGQLRDVDNLPSFYTEASLFASSFVHPVTPRVHFPLAIVLLQGHFDIPPLTNSLLTFIPVAPASTFIPDASVSLIGAPTSKTRPPTTASPIFFMGGDGMGVGPLNCPDISIFTPPLRSDEGGRGMDSPGDGAAIALGATATGGMTMAISHPGPLQRGLTPTSPPPPTAYMIGEVVSREGSDIYFDNTALCLTVADMAREEEEEEEEDDAVGEREIIRGMLLGGRGGVALKTGYERIHPLKKEI